jgi:hypothetical protein
LGIVLPITLSVATDVAVEIIVAIEIVVVVDLDVATIPVAIAPAATPSTPRGGTQRNSRAPRQSRSGHIARISVRIIRIGRRSNSVHHSRVVRGHINNIGTRWLNFDYLLAAARD